MKRSHVAWIIVLAVLITAIAPAAGLAAGSPDASGGSAPPDGAGARITLSDLVLAARWLTGQAAPTPEEMQKLDPNGDGTITLSEVVVLAQKYISQQGATEQPSPSPAPDDTAAPAPSGTVRPSESPSPQPTSTSAAWPSVTPAPTSGPLPTSNPAGNVLVVYYSATGGTRRIAGLVASEAGADLILSLEPVDPYTREDLNYRDPDSRTSQEYYNPELRDVPLIVDTVENWEGYDTVFIGYPIWWGSAAWPVNKFLTANDFDGKTVIPFCTSGSSGIGQSAQLLEEMAQGGTWLPGQRFSVSASEDTVRQWIAGLDLE